MPATAAPRSKTIRWSLILAGLALAGGLFAWLRSPPNPRYDGRTLSSYLHDVQPRYGYYPGLGVSPSTIRIWMQDQQTKNNRAEAAIQALGPKAIPLLESWRRSNEALRRRILNSASQPCSRLAWLLKWDWLTFEKRMVASDVLNRLVPEHAVPLLPRLREEIVANEPPVSEEAATLFGNILRALPKKEAERIARANRDLIDYFTRPGRTELPGGAHNVLRPLIEYNPSIEPEEMLRSLWRFRAQRFSGIGTIFQMLDPDGFWQNLLYLEMGSANERPAAALYFRDQPVAAERIVPLLISNLAPTNRANLLQTSCDALGSYGPVAAAALPELRDLTKHHRAYVANAASNAIVQISR